jgi:hypothetical protein
MLRERRNSPEELSLGSLLKLNEGSFLCIFERSPLLLLPLGCSAGGDDGMV